MGMNVRPDRHDRMRAAGGRVLIVEIPGWATTRIAVERAVSADGWRLALTPADADLLVVCGQSNLAWDSVIDVLRSAAARAGCPGRCAGTARCSSRAPAQRPRASDTSDGRHTVRTKPTARDRPQPPSTPDRPTHPRTTWVGTTCRCQAELDWQPVTRTGTAWKWMCSTSRWDPCCRRGRWDDYCGAGCTAT